MPACRYVEENDLATMLATKGSSGIAQKVNLGEHVCICQAQIRLPTLALKPRGHINRSPKTGVSVAPQKGLKLRTTRIAIYYKKNSFICDMIIVFVIVVIVVRDLHK